MSDHDRERYEQLHRRLASAANVLGQLTALLAAPERGSFWNGELDRAVEELRITISGGPTELAELEIRRSARIEELMRPAPAAAA